jgi:glucuronosyltransferase
MFVIHFLAVTLPIQQNSCSFCSFPAHPNIKLFITQCGLQSFQEAVYHGVPLLGVPFFGDQKYNAKKIATEEIGLQLSFHELTKDTLLTTIKEMLNNSK